MQTGTGAPATIASGYCILGSSRLFSDASTTPTQQSFRLYTTAVNNLRCYAVDSNGLTTNCPIAVTVVDNEPPVMTCNPFVANVSANSDHIVFDWTTWATATDNVNVTGQICTGGPADNVFVYSRIPTPITCYAWDKAGNNQTCTFTVTVDDFYPPHITCPADLSANTSLNSNTGSATFSATATDNVHVASVVCNPSSNSPLTIGAHRVTCTATDTAGNRRSCTFKETIYDYQPPVLVCPLGVDKLSASPTAPNISTTLPVSATDNSGAIANLTCSPGGYPSPYTFSMGTTSVTCTGVDPSHNSAQCSFSVNVVDTTPPVLHCPNQQINTDPGKNYGIPILFSSLTATDNVGVTAFHCLPGVGDGTPYIFGTTNVSCYAADAAGNHATCSFNLVVVDNQNPIVSCPPGMSIPTSASSNIVVTFPHPNATDNVAVANTTLIVTVNGVNQNLPPTTSSYTFATWNSVTFTFRAIDTSGHSSLCYWPVTVYSSGTSRVTVPPTIYNCPTPSILTDFSPPPDINNALYANVTIIHGDTVLNQPYGLVSWNPINATAAISVAQGYLDWSPNLYTASTLGLNAGAYLVAYGAVDAQGNSAYCVFKVNITDNQPPAWADCPSNQLYPSGPAIGAVPNLWPSQGVYATDNFQINNPYGTCTSIPSGFCPTGGSAITSILDVGFYQFYYSAVDAYGNQAPPCNFNVTIRDNSPPKLYGCSTNLITVNTDPGLATANISDQCPAVTATDNVRVTSLTYGSSPKGYNCSTPIPITNTSIIITLTALDAADNAAYCFFVVTVHDREKPVLYGCNSSADTAVNTNTDYNKATSIVNLPTVYATDNSGHVALSYTSFPTGYGSGMAFPLGVTIVTYNAQDPSGNTISCNFRIDVHDKQPPTILNFPSNGTSYTYTVNTSLGLATGALTLPNLDAIDNVEISSKGFSPNTYMPGVEYNFTVGTTELIYTAVDTSLNTASVTINIIVVDNQAPIFTSCPSTSYSTKIFIKNASLGLPTAPVFWPPVQAYDNVDTTHVQYTQTSRPIGYTDNSLFRIGNTTITYFASDAAGNTNHCIFLVEIIDTQPPVLICPASFSVYSSSYLTNYTTVTWRSPVITDNNYVQGIITNYFPGRNYTVGTYNVTYYAWDPSMNNASCSFVLDVVQTVTTVSPQLAAASSAASSSSTGTVAAGAGAGGVLLILFVLLVIFIVYRRNAKQRVQAAASGYAELMAMSDEFILERARVCRMIVYYRLVICEANPTSSQLKCTFLMFLFIDNRG